MSSAASAVTYNFRHTRLEPDKALWEPLMRRLSEGGIQRVSYTDKTDSLSAAHDPDYVLEPIYPKYIPLEDEHELPTEEQLRITQCDSPNAESPEEHLAPANSAVVVPADEHVSPPKGTEPASISLPPEAEVERLLAMTTPSPSPPISLSPPCQGVRLSRIASTQALIDRVTAALPSPPLPPLPPSLYIPPPVDRRDDIVESEQPPRKRLCLSTLGSRYEIRESSTARSIRDQGVDNGFVSTVDAEARRQEISEVGYGIRDTWVGPAEAVPEIAPMTVGEVNTRVTELAELHEHDTQDLYALLEDAQDSRSRISQRVDMDSQRVDLLMGDRMTLLETVWMVEEEAYASREAWAHSIGLSQATHQELQTHRDHAELLALREQRRRARQPAPDTRISDHQDASGDADSHV
ncbi:hypothetical protein Tco_0006299 [Tanacetum coccineum]